MLEEELSMRDDTLLVGLTISGLWRCNRPGRSGRADAATTAEKMADTKQFTQRYEDTRKEPRCRFGELVSQ